MYFALDSVFTPFHGFVCVSNARPITSFCLYEYTCVRPCMIVRPLSFRSLLHTHLLTFVFSIFLMISILLVSICAVQRDVSFYSSADRACYAMNRSCLSSKKALSKWYTAEGVPECSLECLRIVSEQPTEENYFKLFFKGSRLVFPLSNEMVAQVQYIVGCT